MRDNAFCMVFHVRWISHQLVSESRGKKNPSHMVNHTKCISSKVVMSYPAAVVSLIFRGSLEVCACILRHERGA